MSDELMAKYQKLVVRGENTPKDVEGLQKDVRVTEPPAAFGTWVRKNHECMLGWKQMPYWFNDNKDYSLIRY